MIRNNLAALGISLALILLSATAFWPVTNHAFINYDDQDYVTDNPMVLSGVNLQSVQWAFVTDHAGNWHPMTWLSHMLDVQLFNNNAGGHHLTSLLLHIANSVLLFWLLKNTTRALWASGFVAALFAIHPLHVESVAWVSERKDVLSTFFLMLTLLFYAARSASHRDAHRKVSFLGKYYLVALLFFALGLMSKPMLVTTPFVLLLLDYWPLNRFSLSPSRFSNWCPLLVEKIPFFALSIASSAITFVVQQRGGAVAEVNVLPIGLRISNAIVSYVTYLKKTFWPTDLAVFYPYSTSLSTAAIAFSILILAGITFFTVWHWRRFPFLIVGWLWYLGTLVPVIGLVQVGMQSMADRYTYIPLIGIFIAITWSACRFFLARSFHKTAFTIAPLAILTVCWLLTRQQAIRWRDSETLFSHALKVTSNNAVAEYSLGAAFVEQGKVDEAFPHFVEAVRLKPDYSEAHNNIGLTFALRGNFDDAINHYRIVLSIKPGTAETHYNLGRAMALKGNTAEAEKAYRAALEIRPNLHDARNSLGILLGQQGKPDDAAAEFRKILEMNSNHADAHFNLADLLAKQGRFDKAVEHFSRAIQIKPDDADAHQKIALAFIQQNNFSKAVGHFTRVMELRPDDAPSHYNLALALVLAGNRTKAIPHYRQSLRLQPDSPAALNDLAWILATHPSSNVRNGNEALHLAQTAVALVGDRDARFYGTLDAALAETGRFTEAIEAAEKTKSIALKNNQAELAQAAQERIALYRSGKPFHQQ